jgi:hypothetical protein
MLKKYKDEIGSLGSIFSTIGVLAALGFSIYALYPKPKEPALDLLVKRIDSESERLVIYNGGDGVCAELNVTYPETETKAFILFNYEASSLMNAEYDIKSKTAKYPAKFPFYWDECENGQCVIEAGILLPQRLISIQFTGLDTFPVRVECIGQSYEAVINET